MSGPEDVELFQRRQQRKLTCTFCSGTGKITVPQVLVHSGTPLHGAPADAVAATVVGASSIFECTRVASEIARQSNRPVAFDFGASSLGHRNTLNGGDLVVIHPRDDPDYVAHDWWFRTYGKTYKESMADR